MKTNAQTPEFGELGDSELIQMCRTSRDNTSCFDEVRRRLDEAQRTLAEYERGKERDLRSADVNVRFSGPRSRLRVAIQRSYGPKILDVRERITDYENILSMQG